MICGGSSTAEFGLGSFGTPGTTKMVLSASTRPAHDVRIFVRGGSVGRSTAERAGRGCPDVRTPSSRLRRRGCPDVRTWRGWRSLSMGPCGAAALVKMSGCSYGPIRLRADPRQRSAERDRTAGTPRSTRTDARSAHGSLGCSTWSRRCTGRGERLLVAANTSAVLVVTPS